MSESDSAEARRDEIRENIATFLQTNFPQIQMHGGQAAVKAIDLDAGVASIVLGGYCNGCGLSPMTTQAIKNHLPAAIDGIEHVSVTTDAL